MADDLIQGFRKRYADVHPLLFARSVERSRSPGELFEILESIPERMPVVWNDASRRWLTTDDLLQCNSYVQSDVPSD